MLAQTFAEVDILYALIGRVVAQGAPSVVVRGIQDRRGLPLPERDVVAKLFEQARCEATMSDPVRCGVPRRGFTEAARTSRIIRPRSHDPGKGSVGPPVVLPAIHEP